MNIKKQQKRKLITLQNTYGRIKGKTAWLKWLENQKKEDNNG